MSGGHGDDRLDGQSGDDFLSGSFGRDRINGDAGNDTIYGNNEVDTLYGSDGFDLIYGGKASDRLFGGKAEDTLYGGTGHDFIDGESSHDTAYGGDGNDWIDGSSGSDTLYGGSGNDSLIGGTGNDVFSFQEQAFGLGDGTVLYLFGNDTVADFDTDSGDILDLSVIPEIRDFNNLVANHLRDNNGTAEIFIGDSSILLEGYSVADVSDNGAIRLESFRFANSVYGTAGGDQISRTAATEGEHIYGEAGQDTLTGGQGNDWILGGSNHDTLNGGEGDDYLVGGSGIDTFVFDASSGNDTILDFAAEDGETLDISGWTDIEDWDDLLDNHLRNVDGGVEIYAGDHSIRIDSYDRNDFSLNGPIRPTNFASLVGPAVGSEEIIGDNTAELIYGGEGDDTIRGNGGSDTIYGGSGDDNILDSSNEIDLLYGGAGNDTIQTGLGADTIVGGSGDDYMGIYFYADGQHFVAGIGNDTIAGSAEEMTIEFIADDAFSFSTTRIRYFNEDEAHIILFEDAIDDYDDLLQNHLRLAGSTVYIEHDNFQIAIEVSSYDLQTMDDFTAPDSAWADVFTF